MIPDPKRASCEQDYTAAYFMMVGEAGQMPIACAAELPFGLRNFRQCEDITLNLGAVRNIALTSGLVLDLAQHQRRRMMFTMTKIAVATALVAATSTVVLAEFDPNLANRYAAYAGSISGNGLISSPAQLHQGRGATVGQQESSFEIDRSDRRLRLTRAAASKPSPTYPRGHTLKQPA